MISAPGSTIPKAATALKLNFLRFMCVNDYGLISLSHSTQDLVNSLAKKAYFISCVVDVNLHEGKIGDFEFNEL